MLPGLRILFATTVLAISILVFGLGAAALLRAAHEEFASLPSWRLAQQPVLTPFTPQVPRLETTPVLAMLRIEPPGGTKPLPETLRRDAVLPEATTYQPPLQASHGLSLPADPVAAANPPDAIAPNHDSDIKEADEATASAPVSPQAAGSNAQASLDLPARPDIPAEEADAPGVKTPDVNESKIVEPARPAESGAAELKPIDVTSQPSPTEASEPLSTVASIERSSEATASATEPRPVVKKARRPSARTLALRREAARVRAEARARAKQLQQQQQAFPLFGG
jgi:hypothetical protein